MGFKEEFFDMFCREDFNFLSEKQIIARLNAAAFDRKVYSKAINDLVEEGQLARNKNGKIALPERFGLKRGRISGNAKGFGFFVPEDGSPEDWFIPPSKLYGAMHGDTVLARLVHKDSTEGEVEAIIVRANTKLVGTYESRGKYGFILPDDKRISYDVYVAEGASLKCRSGQKAVVLITKYPEDGKNPEGNILEVLGNPYDAGTDILSIIRSFGLYEEFPDKVAEKAKKLPAKVDPSELKGRTDYRGDLVITIDGADAKDLDDAVCLKKTSGGYKLFVHIADVAHYVKFGSEIDKEAYARGTSVYFPDRVLPMLPRELSNGICSLHSGEDKLTLSACIDINNKGKVTGGEIAEGVISTAHRMTYDEVTEILEGDRGTQQKYSDVTEMIELMQELSILLTKRREERGMVDFNVTECKIELDGSGRVSGVKPYPRKQSNRIIEEFMLLANEFVAERFFYMSEPFIYRVHEQPTEEKMLTLRTFLEQIGLRTTGKLSGEVHPKTIQQIIKDAEGKEIEGVVSRVTLRAMQKARYVEQNLGHFGLAAKYYCHFTSPIRRYPDLAIHRIIKCCLKGESTDRFIDFVTEAAKHSSVRERLAEEAEREVENLKKAEYMSYNIGNEYDGIISGVQDFGFFVELPNTIEGLVRIESLPADRYTYVESSMCLRGADHCFRIGDKITVKVYRADLNLRKVEFCL